MGSPVPHFPFSLLSLPGEILTVSITLNTNEALMFLPIFYLSLQDSMYPTIHLTFLPKDSQTS